MGSTTRDDTNVGDGRAPRRSVRIRRWRNWTFAASLGVLALLFVGLNVEARSQAHVLVTNPVARRHVPPTTPADDHLAFEDVTVKTSDGLRVVGWYLPGATSHVVVVIHGFKDYRAKLLDVSSLFVHHGYSVLVPALRAHDRSEGNTITFGINEMRDLDAWMAYLASRRDVDAQHVALFGVSMGGAIAIRYAATHQNVGAVATDCAFSSSEDTVATSVRFFTGLPPFPFAPLILFWAGHETGQPIGAIDAKAVIGEIAPRPVFLMQGGADTVVSPSSGQRLFDAARQPKEFWFEPSLGHAQFFQKRPHEFEQRVVGFFDHALDDRSAAPTRGASR
jgi:fermentation-respiration switch protein FrsA (DUF1100 family)